MNLGVRRTLDRVFTGLTGASIVLLALVLIAVLGPMVYRGSSAVLFQGTVEFRKMQRDLFRRADETTLATEVAETDQARQVVYEMIDRFRKGIDIEAMSSEARQINREYGRELRHNDASGDEYSEAREVARTIRDLLEEAFNSQDIELIRRNVAEVLAHKDEARFTGTVAERYFVMAADFLEAAEHINLSHYHDYLVALDEVEVILFGSIERPGLLGPRPNQAARPLAMSSYGATRWDQAQALLDRLLWAERWVEREPGQPLVRERSPRAELFHDTALEPLFTYVPQHVNEMLRPRFTVYWQFFLDDNFDSHYFGGVGPELLGTLLITVLGMLFVIPLGVISAAYLVECASEGPAMRILRMSINTLAGVPSIVFGLFGLAFFVLFLFPKLGFEPKACILAASLTLAVLTLPVMIRASEEAIRTVPRSYK